MFGPPDVIRASPEKPRSKPLAGEFEVCAAAGTAHAQQELQQSTKWDHASQACPNNATMYRRKS